MKEFSNIFMAPTKMNYQILLEDYVLGQGLNAQEIKMLSLELDAQIENIKISRSQACIKIAPNHICKAALVCEGSFWITCLASVLDKCDPPSLGIKARGVMVFDELVRHGYIAM